MIWEDSADRVEYFARGCDKEEETVCTTAAYPRAV